MLGDSSSVLSSSGDVAAVAVTAMHEGGDGGGGGGGLVNNSGELLDDNNKGGARGGDMEMERGFGANRWPRQETLALLKIRSDMDAVFRDSSSKGPLWEEVSRKLAELGYHRSAKKCKEKFENVYKYHKRTKDGRTGKQDKNKTYRFFDQLEALDNSNITGNQPPLSSATAAATTTTTTTTKLQHQTPPPPMPVVVNSNPVSSTAAAGGGGAAAPVSGSIISTVPSTAHHVNMSHPQYNIAPAANNNNYIHSTQPLSSSNNPTVPPNQNTNTTIINPSSSLHHNQIRTTQQSAHPTDALSYSTSSSTSSDEELEPGSRRKRKWRVFFEKLMRDVIEKQEAMQKKFMEEIERREHERMVREEAWRMQEMARLDREREILAHERSTAAAKDAALMAFLQKVAEQKNPAGAHPPTSTAPLESTEAPAQGQALQQQQKPTQPQQLQVHPVSVPVSIAVAAPIPIAQYHPGTGNVVVDNQGSGNGENSALAMGPSRWPKVEVQALIELRTNLDTKYQDNGPKGPLWEEISSAMRKLGYNRSAKRCKEKWENINKYFKKVKESNRKRSEDSKTCPYFHQLDALYKEKNRLEHSSSSNNNNNNNNNNIQLSSSKPESSSSMAAPLMVAPEQQWPPVQPPPRQPDSVMEDADSENMDQNNHEDEDEDDDEEDDEGEYEIVPNRPSSIGAAME